MGWWYKDPAKFPALFITVLRRAVAEPGSQILIFSSSTRSDVEAIAERFRWFRWCIRKVPSAHTELTRMLDKYQIRTKLIEDEVGFILSVIAKPTKVSEFERLNPDLAMMLLPDCQ